MARTIARLDARDDFLSSICHAFASACTVDEVGRETLRWVRGALGPARAGVRLAVVGPDGRLGVVAESGPRSVEGRLRSARRRAALEAKRPLLVGLGRSSSMGLLFQPLVSRGEALGVLEVVAPRPVLEERGDLLESVSSQAAIALGSVRRHAETQRAVEEQLVLDLAWIAHEVRRPLVGARATVERLLFGSAGGRDALLRASGELERAARSMNGILRWAGGTGSLRRRPLDLTRVVESGVASACPEPEDRDRVSVRAGGRVPVRGDAEQLRGAVANLVTNALTHAPGRVRVEVGTDGSRGLVRVRDSGPGIAPELRENVFDPLVRGRGAPDGAGLGLFIARRIVEAHGGTIDVRSSAGGATFTMALPITAERRPARSAS